MSVCDELHERKVCVECLSESSAGSVRQGLTIGLRMAFATHASKEILSGVTVSMMPRKEEKPTVETVSGITPGRRQSR